MNTPPPISNPFLALQSRYLVLGTFLVASLAVGSLYALLGEWQLLPPSNEDPISNPILTIGVLTVMGSAILWVGRGQGLKVDPLFGPLFGQTSRRSVHRFSIFYGLLLVASLLLFSLGISSVVFYLLSLSFPGYVSQLIESNVLLNGSSSLYPQFYDSLMLFLLLVYAPLVEELIFRGFLLQRWSMKWGLPWGLIASSVLFGLLHLNNPLGLALFGLVMGLLYVRTHSLWVPIACHSLNNLAAVGIDRLSQIASGGQTSTVSDIQELWWMSLALVVVSVPFLAWFVWHNWPKAGDEIPYLVNVGRQ